MTALPGQTHTRLRVGVPDPGEREAAVTPGEPRAVLRVFHVFGVVARPAVTAPYGGHGLVPAGACYRDVPISLDRRGIDAPLLLREQSR